MWSPEGIPPRSTKLKAQTKIRGHESGLWLLG